MSQHAETKISLAFILMCPSALHPLICPGYSISPVPRLRGAFFDPPAKRPAGERICKTNSYDVCVCVCYIKYNTDRVCFRDISIFELTLIFFFLGFTLCVRRCDVWHKMYRNRAMCEDAFFRLIQMYCITVQIDYPFKPMFPNKVKARISFFPICGLFFISFLPSERNNASSIYLKGVIAFLWK